MNARVAQKHPCLVDEKCLEDSCDCLIRDDSVGPMKDVEEQRLQNVGVLAHRLKVEALKFRERDRVFRVIEQKPELPSTGPFRQAIRHAMTKSVREHTQRAQLIFLQVGHEKIQSERLACASPTENHGVRHIAVMQIQEVRCVVVGLKNRQIFLAKMRVLTLATVEREEKREVGIVRVKKVEGTQIKKMIAGDGRQKRIQQVVLLFVELRIMDAEDFVEFRAGPVYLREVQVVNHHGQ